MVIFIFRDATRKEIDKFIAHMVRSRTFDAFLKLPGNYRTTKFIDSLAITDKRDEKELKRRINRLKNNLDVTDLSDIDNAYSKQLFFKCIDYKTFHKNKNILPHSILRDYSATSIEREFLTMMDLYTVVPKNIPRPVSLVVKQRDENKIVGILQEHIEGINIGEYVQQLRASKYYENRIKLRNSLIKIITTFISKNVAHGDISPENILIDKNGDIKIIDPQPIDQFYKNRLWDKMYWYEGYKRDILIKFNF